MTQVIKLAVLAGFLASATAQAIPLSNPNDPRNWQLATVGTFAQLYFGADTLVNRQKVIDNGLLDDGLFNPAGFVTGTLVTSVGQYSTQGHGTSLDTGLGDGIDFFQYSFGGSAASRFTAANAIDNQWMQVSNLVGETVWDLGFQASKAAVFNTIDHGPLPQEAIESTVYLSNDQITWIQAVTERVWLEGFVTNTDVLWDGFTYAVGTGTGQTFRYASIIHGGPGALVDDGDNEINGVMGLRGDFTPNPGGVPEPGTLALLAAAVSAFAWSRRRRT